MNPTKPVNSHSYPSELQGQLSPPSRALSAFRLSVRATIALKAAPCLCCPPSLTQSGCWPDVTRMGAALRCIMPRALARYVRLPRRRLLASDSAKAAPSRGRENWPSSYFASYDVLHHRRPVKSGRRFLSARRGQVPPWWANACGWVAPALRVPRTKFSKSDFVNFTNTCLPVSLTSRTPRGI